MSSRLFELLARIVNSKIARARLRHKTYPSILRIYPHLHVNENWRDSSVRGIENESGIIMGWVVKSIQQITPRPQSVLLAGEGASAKEIYAGITGLPADRIVTAGLHSDADHRWDFEASPPDGIGKFQCIVSYAILEHILDPFGHVRDLRHLLKPGGRLVIYTAYPGFPYHRHPVDCLRFFPDWFEEVASRLELEVQDGFIGDDHIVYCLANPSTVDN